MSKKENRYQYLLNFYLRVDDYLSNEETDFDNLPEIIVSFCIVVERVLKIKLYRKNVFLIFDGNKLKEDDLFVGIALKKEKDKVETIRFRNIIDRFKVVFKNIFSEDELQTLLDIYEVRNYFIHGYKEDKKITFDQEDLVKRMGTVWGKISQLAVILFGKKAIKRSEPKKKYTEEELEKVLIKEVQEKIKPQQGNLYSYASVLNTESIVTWPSDSCPRCGFNGFSLEKNNLDIFSGIYNPANTISVTVGSILDSYGFSDGLSGLYKCKKCHLELTPKEYEIAKRIKG